VAEKTVKATPAFYLDRRRLGILGEQAAAKMYRNLGYLGLATNFHCRYGELDLVFRKGDDIVFAEVRTRDAGAVITPAETVTYAKQQRVITTAEYYLSIRPWLSGCNMQFDVVEVFYEGEYRCRVHRIENAFTL